MQDLSIPLSCFFCRPGNGLFYKLELPPSFDADEVAELANELNVFETTGVDVPPFFGAWCSQISPGRLSHVGFWPNGMFHPGTVANIACWCMIRSRVARQFIGNRRWLGNNGVVKKGRTDCSKCGSTPFSFDRTLRVDGELQEENVWAEVIEREFQ